MSHRTGDNRTILKARRYNKFESSSTAIPHYVPDKLNNTYTTTTTCEILGGQGLKRNCDEVNESIPKRMCNGLQLSLSSTKNLANNRLQRLKGSLKADLEQKINSTKETGEAGKQANGVTVSHSNTFTNYNEPSKSLTPVHADAYSFPETSSNIKLQNLDKLTTPSPAKTKNTSFISVRETNEYPINTSNSLTVSHTEAFRNFNEPYNSRRSLTKDGHSTSLTSTKNIYKNLEMWAKSSNNYPEKNFANQRLSRLKKVVNDLKSNVEFVSNKNNCEILQTSQNEESPLKSPVNNDETIIDLDKELHGSLHKRVSGLKRNADCSETEIECSPLKKSSPYTCLATNYKLIDDSPRLKACSSEKKDLLSPNINEKIENNSFSSLERSGKNTLKATNVSNRIMKIKKNMETINTTLYHDQLPVRKYNHKETDILEPDTNDLTFLESSKHQESASPCQTSAEANNFDNYKGKWKMTAAWIWNHQNMNGTPDQPENAVVSDIVAEPISEREDHIDDTEEMEWTNAEPEMKNTADREPKNLPEERSKELCIVVDTNVFISGLSRIKDIMNLKITEPTSLIIYVPWMVITELDYMKHSCSDDKLKQKVASAIKFINTELENKNPRFLGQTTDDMEKQKSIGISPDDKILSCCLQASQKYETVILLSNDLNLRSKAMINSISATSANEIIMKILSKTTKTAKSQKIMQKMSMLCSSVICDCAKDTYGDVWSKMDLLSSPPWSLKECLKRFRKYWPTVFQDKVMKQFTLVVDQLLTIFHKNRYFADDSEDYVKFMKLCINLCIFLKDIQQCRGSVENTLRDITKI